MDPDLVPLKEFQAKCGNLLILEEYGEVMSDKYLAHWKRSMKIGGRMFFFINADKLVRAQARCACEGRRSCH